MSIIPYTNNFRQTFTTSATDEFFRSMTMSIDADINEYRNSFNYMITEDDKHPVLIDYNKINSIVKSYINLYKKYNTTGFTNYFKFNSTLSEDYKQLIIKSWNENSTSTNSVICD